MSKNYLDKNVYEAAIERYKIAFKEFDNIYFSFSGGKDSSVMVQLASMVAKELGKKFSILFIDLEAQYYETIRHTEKLIDFLEEEGTLDKAYWICLPIGLRNAVSVIEPRWFTWKKEDKNKWVRDMPDNKWVINEDNIPDDWDWYYWGMEFEEFIVVFAEWFNKINGGTTGAGIGIRSNESLNRYRTIVSTKKTTLNGYGWTTLLKIKDTNIYNFYPIYDWETEDIWIATSKLDLMFNNIYELMYKNGLGVHQQRLCQPYGDDQRDGLDQFRSLEPETWEKVLNRVSGVNFGNIYCKTSLLGNMKSEKPDHMAWEQYAVFLLESIAIYSPELRDHYVEKIETFLSWYEKEDGMKIEDIPDEEDKKLESSKKVASWRRIARAIEKNDFWMSRLSFGQTKSDVKKLYELKKKYHNIIYNEDADTAALKRVSKELNEND